MQTFKELGLSDEIVKALAEIGFETPTEIQSKAIPSLLEKNPDMIGLAQTGTGKTAAFGLPLLDVVDTENGDISAIILAPTRELVQQIALELQAFSKYKKKIHLTTVYGGTSISNQIREIKKDRPSIIVATPGRLIDLINRKVIKLHALTHLVLDEADEMLNMGFQEDIDEILKHTPAEKKTWLFSATMPSFVRKIVSEYMNNPEEVSIDRKNITNQNLSHKYVLVDRRNKTEALKRVIDYIPELYAVIFCRTKRETQEISDSLVSEGYRADAIHGDLSQNQRDTVMNKFRNGSINILVATDVAARGIDVDNLTHVIHYTLPDNAEYYTHRSGRTARAGNKGTSLSILAPNEKRKIDNYSRILKIDFDKVLIPNYADILNQKLLNWTQKLVDTDASEVTAGMLDKVINQLGNMDRDTMLSKLLARQLISSKKKAAKDDLNVDENHKSSRNKDRGGRNRDRGRGRDRDRGVRNRDERVGRNRDKDDRGGRSRDDRGSSRRSRDIDRGRDRDRDRSSSYGRDRDDRSSRRRESSSSNGGTRMFVNIGKMDGMSKGELVDFISKNGNIDKGSIADVDMQKMHTTFDLDKNASKDVTKNFKNVSLEGRDIRCNKK